MDRASSESDLATVKQIYRANKKTLGFLPSGAFGERFAAKEIAIARSQSDVLGYALFTTNQAGELRIAHLAVDLHFRGQRVAEKIVDYLKAEFANLARIRLNCRADFPASRMWQRLGFKAIDRIDGKLAGGSELIVYHYRLNDMPLFGQVVDEAKAALIVCDANVCIDIKYPTRQRHEASCGLCADWLRQELQLATTEEVYNDIARQDEPLRSEMLTEVKKNWRILAPAQEDVEQQRKLIRELLGPPTRDDDASDQSHLAIAAAANAAAFVTFDKDLLKRAPDILGKIGLRVQKPSAVITEFDSVVRSSLYQYRDLRKSGVERCRVKSVKEIEIEQFIEFSRGENEKQFASFLDGVLSLPKRWELYQVIDSANRSMSITVATQENDQTTAITHLRVARRLSGTRLGNSLNEYIAHMPLGLQRNRPSSMLTRIDDACLSPEMVSACLRRGFFAASGKLWRVSLSGFWTQQDLVDQLLVLSQSFAMPASICNRLTAMAIAASGPGNESVALDLERSIFPGKLCFGGLPSYVIPIRPEWAQELFDFRLWDRPLFSPDTQLLINPDSVYYKRPRNSPNTNGARILWYVSGDAKKGGNRIRACSLMTKGVSSTVKDLFREYE